MGCVHLLVPDTVLFADRQSVPVVLPVRRSRPSHAIVSTTSSALTRHLSATRGASSPATTARILIFGEWVSIRHSLPPHQRHEEPSHRRHDDEMREMPGIGGPNQPSQSDIICPFSTPRGETMRHRAIPPILPGVSTEDVQSSQPQTALHRGDFSFFTGFLAFGIA